MERINQFDFYDLGTSLQKMRGLVGAQPASTVMYDVLAVQTAARDLLNGKPIDPGVSRGKLAELASHVDSMVKRHYHDENGGFKWPTSESEPVASWEFNYLNQTISNFEIVFREVVREAATYRVNSKGIFLTPKLVDDAHEHFPSDLQPIIPKKTKDDWCAAGRCLAFSLYSASGFHVTRAVEGTMEAYYQLFTGKQKTQKGWNDYIVALEALDDGAPHGKPNPRTLAELRQMKDDFRNPIAHPRVVLKEADARMLFANGETAIVAMCQEIRDVQQQGATPTLAIVGPT